MTTSPSEVGQRSGRDSLSNAIGFYIKNNNGSNPENIQSTTYLVTPSNIGVWKIIQSLKLEILCHICGMPQILVAGSLL